MHGTNPCVPGFAQPGGVPGEFPLLCEQMWDGRQRLPADQVAAANSRELHVRKS